MTETIDAARQNDCAGTPPAVWGDGTPARPHEVVLTPAKRKGGRQAYAVHFRGELLIVSVDPEFDACRRLLADGFAGHLVTRWAGAAHVALPLTIEQGALLATFDGTTGVRIGKWRPFEMSGDVD